MDDESALHRLVGAVRSDQHDPRNCATQICVLLQSKDRRKYYDGSVESDEHDTVPIVCGKTKQIISFSKDISRAWCQKEEKILTEYLSSALLGVREKCVSRRDEYCALERRRAKGANLLSHFWQYTKRALCMWTFDAVQKNVAHTASMIGAVNLDI